MNRSTQTANKILQERGYVIMAFSPGPMDLPKKGQKINAPVRGYGDEMVPGPFFVLDTATADEYIDQGKRYSTDIRAVLHHADQAIGFFKLVAE